MSKSINDKLESLEKGLLNKLTGKGMSLSQINYVLETLEKVILLKQLNRRVK